jgi:hypothetical protein
MRKLSVLAFSVMTVAITIYGFIQPSYHLQQLINVSPSYASFRIIAALVPAAYVMVPRLRTEFAKKLIRIFGVFLLSFGAITFVSPTFLGSFWNYLPLGDVFISIEGGVLALLLSLQVPANQPPLLAADWNAFKDRFALSRTQKLLSSTTNSKAKTA